MKAILLPARLVLIFALTFILSNISFGQDPHQEDTYYAHLFEINKEWQYHKDIVPEGAVSFNSDRERIQLHLKLVCQYLRDNTPEGLSGDQMDNRLNLVAELEAYGETGVFPTNLYHQVRQPYFVDDFGVHCAVGYMMHRSGNDELVSNIVKEHNYDYVRDIKTDGVVEWANEYGFTVEELKWIQPGYGPQSHAQPIGAGTDGPVTEMEEDQYNNRLLIAGNFNTIDDMPCANIGYYQNDQLECLGQGIDGLINDMFVTYNGVYVVGLFNDGNDNYPAAVYNGNSWTYLGIPSLPGAVATAGHYSYTTNSYELAVSHSSITSGTQELWHYSDAFGWVKKADFVGIVNDINSGTYDRAYAGEFNSVTCYDTSGVIGTYSVNNAILRQNYFDIWTPIQGTEISDNVKAIEFVGSSIFFAGECVESSLGNPVCLSRYLNGSLQVLQEYNYVFWDYDSTAVINDLKFDNDGSLYMSGDFQLSAGMTYGNRAAKFDLVFNQITPLANIDQEANAIGYFENYAFVGGEFMSGTGQQNLNHLGKIVSLWGGIWDPTQFVKVYPNPFDHTIAVEGANENAAYSIVDVNGKVVREGALEIYQINDLESLPKGTYILRVQGESGILSTQIIK